MRLRIHTLRLFGLLVGIVPSSLLGQATPNLLDEARAFMTSYAEDLSAGDAEAIIGRYDSLGAVILLDGRGGARTWEEIARVYRSAWRGPVAFSWHELTFEELTPDAVAVRGGFLYQVAEGGPNIPFTYLAVLLQRGGALRIVLEVEAPDRSVALGGAPM